MVYIIIGCILLLCLLMIILKKYKKIKKDEYSLLSKYTKESDIVFLGDSLTDFYDLNKYFKTIFIYNRGIAGDTTKNVLNRLEKNVLVLKPKTVYLNIGTNDLMYFKSCNYIISNIKRIIDILNNNLIKVKLISLYPVNRFKKFYSLFCVNFRTNKKIMRINQILKLYCQENDIDYIDMFTHLKNKNNRLNKLYTKEGLHISDIGYSVITEVLKKELANG